MPAPSCGHLNGIECESCKELTEIETQLEELHKRRYQTLVKRNYVHSPLIHQFPLEINTYIFLFAFPPQEACSWCSNPHDKASPLILTKVCQTWRALALSTPRLWSSISFDTGNPNFPLLNHQIAHSGAVPLTVFLVSGYGLNQELANAKQAMSLVIKQLHRVVSFYLLFTEEVAMACGSISGLDYPKTAPLLEELHVHFLEEGPSNSFELTTSDFGLHFFRSNLPRLVQYFQFDTEFLSRSYATSNVEESCFGVHELGSSQGATSNC